MQLLTQKLRAELPVLHGQEDKRNPTVHAKFFCKWSNWTCFVTEGSQDEGAFLLFGYIIGDEEVWGYFSLSEMEKVRGPCGLKIERDSSFKRAPFNEVIQRYRRERP